MEVGRRKRITWESRMKSDELNGGLKIFHGEEDNSEESRPETQTGFQRISQTHNKLPSLVDLVMWRDVSKSAFVFGIGTFIIIASSYTKDINISFKTVVSYLGLVYLAVIFLFKSIICRGVTGGDDTNQDYVVGEEEVVWLVKMILPYLNEFLLKFRALFYGDPATTMRLAIMLLVLARFGSTITIWKMAKLGFFGVFSLPKICSSHSMLIPFHAHHCLRGHQRLFLHLLLLQRLLLLFTTIPCPWKTLIAFSTTRFERSKIHPYHPQWPPATVPPPPPTPTAAPPLHHHSMPMENPNRLSNDEVNCKGEHPMGFALFTTPPFAIAAKDALQEMVFDEESKSVLHTEMAKKNLFVKRGIVADSSAYDQSKRMRTAGDYTHTGYSSPSPFHPPPAPVWGPHHGYMAPAPPPYDPYGGYPVPPVPMPAPAPVPAPSNYVHVQNIKDNPPCNTLFIGNLGENINEEELRGLFIMQPGFKQMKVLRQERHTVCFIEFEDVNTATNVHHILQGAVIPSSGSVGMRIQYSKNPFGKRKDSNHPAAAVGTNGVPPPMSYQ